MTRTILMIHGYGMTGEGWTPAAEVFRKAGYAVETPTIRPGLRTIGPPSAELGGLSLADYVAELSALAAVTAARDGVKPIVFGHSMGGLIAQKLAESNLTSGMVLFAPASPADARGRPKLSPLFTFLNAALTPGGPTKPVKMWKTGFRFGVVNAVPAERHDALYAQAVYDSGRVLQDLAYPDRDPSRTAHVDAAKVTVPVMVLAGARDRTTPVEDLRLVGRKYSGADYREYPDHAHWLIDEPGSAALFDAAKAWLAEKGLGPASAPPPSKAAPKAEPKAAPAPAAPAAKVDTAQVAEKPAPLAVPAAKPRAPAKAKAPSRAKAIVAEPAVKPAAQAKPAKAEGAPAGKAAKPKPAPKAPAPASAKTAAAKKAAAPAPAKPDDAPVVKAAKPKVALKAAPAPSPAAKPAAKPATKTASKAKPKAEAPAKPAPKAKAASAEKAPAAPSAAAPAQPKPKPKPKPAAAAKPAATTTPAKTSPRGKKSV